MVAKGKMAMVYRFEMVAKNFASWLPCALNRTNNSVADVFLLLYKYGGYRAVNEP